MDRTCIKVLPSLEAVTRGGNGNLKHLENTVMDAHIILDKELRRDIDAIIQRLK